MLEEFVEMTLELGTIVPARTKPPPVLVASPVSVDSSETASSVAFSC